MNYKQWDTSTKVVVQVFLLLLILAFLWVIRDVLVILLLAMVLASAMEPLADYLRKHKIPRAVSVFSVYIVVLGLAGLIFSQIIPLVIEQLRLVQANLPQFIADFQTQYPNVFNFFGNVNLSGALKDFFNPENGGATVVTRTVGIFNGLFAFLTVLVVSFYLVAQEKSMKELIRSVLPPSKQEFAMQLVTKIQHKMGLWVLGQLILSVFIFVFSFFGLTILGVKYALVLALLAGLMEVVPYIGPTLSAVPAVFFAFLQSPTLALGVLILYILIQKTESYILVPKVMQKTIGASPLVILLSLLIGFKLAGVLGLLLAVPLAGAITVTIAEFAGESGKETQ